MEKPLKPEIRSLRDYILSNYAGKIYFRSEDPITGERNFVYYVPIGKKPQNINCQSLKVVPIQIDSNEIKESTEVGLLLRQHLDDIIWNP